jgi:hypothetical protein
MMAQVQWRYRWMQDGREGRGWTWTMRNDWRGVMRAEVGFRSSRTRTKLNKKNGKKIKEKRINGSKFKLI